MSMTFEQRRLECLRLANVLATAKVIPPEQVLTLARQFCAYVDGEEQPKASGDDISRLRGHYQR